MPNGESMTPMVAINAAALYLKMRALNARKAPKLADTETAIKPIGAASTTVRLRKNPKSGTVKIAPPAPVKPRTTPTDKPSRRLVTETSK